LFKWDFELADILIDLGAAEVPQISCKIDATNFRGESRFTAALRNKRYRVAEHLLQQGASKPNGLVIKSIDVDMSLEQFEWLLNHGFDINEQNKVGLHIGQSAEVDLLPSRLEWRQCIRFGGEEGQFRYGTTGA